MKKLYNLITFAFVILLCPFNLLAQATATANSSATIITPITITKTVDLNFGNVAVSSAPGNVAISVAGTRTPTGGVTLPSTTGSPSAATFTVTGEPSYTYAITLPSGPVTIANGNNTMTVTSFVSSPSSVGTLTSGTQTLVVASTLNVNAGQAAGTYMSPSPFSVTVNYN